MRVPSASVGGMVLGWVYFCFLPKWKYRHYLDDTSGDFWERGHNTRSDLVFKTTEKPRISKASTLEATMRWCSRHNVLLEVVHVLVSYFLASVITLPSLCVHTVDRDNSATASTASIVLVIFSLRHRIEDTAQSHNR
eukprot:scaffold808_cov196-Alexandrium_tamarense.AAC.71